MRPRRLNIGVLLSFAALVVPPPMSGADEAPKAVDGVGEMGISRTSTTAVIIVGADENTTTTATGIVDIKKAAHPVLQHVRETYPRWVDRAVDLERNAATQRCPPPARADDAVSFWVCEKHRIVYTLNSKAASTYIRDVIVKGLNGTTISTSTYEQQYRDDPTYVLFTIVRDPMKRFHSGRV